MLRFGFDIGGTNIAAGIIDENNRLIAKDSVKFPRGEGTDAVVAACAEVYQAILDRTGAAPDAIAGVGVAVPGSVNPEAGLVIDAHNLGFHHTPLASLLEAALHKPVCLVNDADAATLAEHRIGALKGTRTAMMITIGTGIGGGLIVNGMLFGGGRGNGTEPGHMVLCNGGRHCTCGIDGCAETYCSATRLAKDGAAFGMSSAKDVIEAAKQGNPDALELFRAYIDDFGSYIASIVNLLDPERIAIGGGVSGAGSFLLDPLRADVARKCFFETCPEIVVASAGNDAGIIGAGLIIS
ncbi:MAG: ROK family protein [Clostridia bacterium]|nr:ROK family protein [Clostridia bacterium]